ncbi:unnamed protein product [Cylicocyclus nassatus]|uniref:Uncharacterized protein n=1 Tax=Cylicocyclus nassatus TaxID=53992 RepID=A0AA36DL89_CYLNA|nr:unnamed protein product [Cylicocyclus nassatus]
MPCKNENQVSMRLVEYPRNGRVLRRWTYERSSERCCPMSRDVFSQGLCGEGSTRTESARYSYHERPGASSPQAHDLKQESIFKREKKQQEEEAAEERQTEVKRQRKGSKYDNGDSDRWKATIQMGSAERRKRSKEPSDLQINEGAALKEMSKLYQDLLERFENLKQKQETQVATESDRTRLRRLAEKDDSVYKMLKELIATVKNVAEDFKTCAMLAGSSMKRAEHHERDLDHIILELESA